jgi:hypothetical protein
MTNTTLLQRFSIVLAAGGLAWLAKMAVIGATDGAEAGTGSAAATVFYLLGVALMPVGLAGVAAALAAGRHLVLRVVAGIAGFLSFFASYLVLEGIAQAIVGDTRPAWLGDEVGILVTGVVLMTAGLLAAQRSQLRRHTMPVA